MNGLSIALVGMPGGGKSTVGRQLARRLCKAFIDSDAYIEAQVGRSIRAYFEAEGEATFRSLEARVIAELVRVPDAILATGGGAILNAGTRQLLREHTTVIYLRSTPEELFRRLRHDQDRPLLQVADPLAQLRELFKERDPLYKETAHFVFDTGRPSVSHLVNMVAMQLELAGVLLASKP